MIPPVTSFTRKRASIAAHTVRVVSSVAYLMLLAVCAQAQSAHMIGSVSAVDSSVVYPRGVAIDAAGNLYVAQGSSGPILKETPSASGYTSTVVATGFNNIAGLAVDSNGNVYVADRYANQVYGEMLSGGVYTQVSIGTGLSNPNGVGVDSSGNVYIADTYNNRVLKEVPAAGTYTQSIVDSTINDPNNVAFDGSGNLFVLGGGAVTEEMLSGSTYTGTAVISGISGSAFGLAIDSAGDLYIADGGNNQLVEEILSSGTYTQSVIYPAANYPAGVAVDVFGNVFFTTDTLHELSPLPSFGTVNVGTTSPVLSILFDFDSGGTIDSLSVLTEGATNLDFVDAGTGSCTASPVSPDYRPNYNMGDTCTVDVTFTPTISGVRSGAVLLSKSGSPVATGYINGIGTAAQLTFSPGTISTIGSGFGNTNGVAVDGLGDVFVADVYNGAIDEIVAVKGVVSSSSTVITLAGGSNNYPYPTSVAVDGAGNVFFADQTKNAVYEIIAVNGAVSASSSIDTPGSGFNPGDNPFSQPGGVAVDRYGDVFVADSDHGAVKEIVAGNNGVSFNSNVITISSSFALPIGVAVDNNGNVFVADSNNNAVYEIEATNGMVSPSSTVIPVGSGFSQPSGVAVDAHGNVFVADYNNSAVKEIVAVNGAVSSSSVVHTVGSGFANPAGVALDAKGNLFVGDSNNSLVKEIDFADPPSLSFASTAVGATSTDSPQIVTVTNYGNAALTFEVPTSGLNPSISTGFTLGVSSTCPQISSTSDPATLAAGASCTRSVSFTPTVSGSNSGSLVSVDNALNAIGPSYATQTIALNGTATAPVFTATTAIASTALTQDHAATTFTPVTASGGTGTLTYSVSPALPTGLTFSSATGAVSGTPTTVSAATTYTVTATDTTSATATATFSLTVNAAITASQAVASTTLTQNHATTAFTPVTASGGTGTLTYSVSPTLPAGLSFSSSTGAVSGTPTAVSATTTYTVTVTDSNGATGSATFSLTVNAAITTTTAVASTALTHGHAATAFTPVTASGGTGVLTYSVSPSLPAGLSFSSSTGAVSGTPTAVSAATTYTVTVTDSNGATATATFSLTVNAAITTTTAIASTVLTQGHAATAFTPVTASGGTGTLTYSVSPALPSGLSLSSETGAVSGTPSAVSAATTYTVTVTDSNGATATATFSLTVNSSVVATTAVGSTALTQGHASTSFIPVTATGGTGTLTYSISPALPPGLSFASASGTVSGTPTAVSAATTYTVTVTDSNGATATATFSLTVNAAIATTTAIASTALTQSHATTAFTPVTASGGTGTLTYSVSPALPSGMSFSAATGAVSGTPTAVSAATTYTVTVTDANGATGTATFSLTVDASVVASTPVPSTLLTRGHASTAFTPVTASGGTGTLTYSVSPALPSGLSFSSETGTVSGTPTVSSAAATYTVTVTDTNGATTTATFSLTVNSAITTTTNVASKALTSGYASGAFTPVTATGGTGTLTYSISPELPSGLTFSSTTGTVSGTATGVSEASIYTVTVTDANGATAMANFSLTVNPAVSASVAVSSTVLNQGHAATAFNPVTASGGTGTLTYRVSPTLPAGLSFSPTGTVSGKPTGFSAATTYTVTVTDANGATGAATFSLTVNATITTSTAVTSSSLTPKYGSPVVLAATVTPAPADTPPGTVSFYSGSTLLGTVALNTSGTAALTIALPLGENEITAVYSGSVRYAGSTSTALSVSDRAVSTLTFSASPTTQLYNNPIVMTAQVTSSTAGSVSGTVSFLDGTSVIATVQVGTNGQASYSISTMADGSHSLTATYSGDSNFQPSASSGAAVAITVGDVDLNLGNDNNKSVLPGAAVTYSFPVSPEVTPKFLYDVHLSATGLPPGATYSFSPASIPAGSGSLPVTLTVQTAKGVASLDIPASPGQRHSSRGLTALAFGLLLPLFGVRQVRRRLKELPIPLAMILCAVVSMGAMIGLTGCGAGGFYGPTATSGSYTITVTATSADLVRTSTVKLTIQ